MKDFFEDLKLFLQILWWFIRGWVSAAAEALLSDRHKRMKDMEPA